MTKDIVVTSGAPRAGGAYSQGVRIGELIFTMGQLGLVPGSTQLAGPDIASQTRQVLQNIQAIVEAGGSCLNHVLKTTVYLEDMRELPAMNEVCAQFFTLNAPARSVVQSAGLHFEARVEIEAIAVVCDCCCQAR